MGWKIYKPRVIMTRVYTIWTSLGAWTHKNVFSTKNGPIIVDGHVYEIIYRVYHIEMDETKWLWEVKLNSRR